MNSRAFTLSLVIAGIAAFMAYSFLDNKEEQYKKAFGDMTPVVIAKVDIKELELIDDRKVETILVPKKYQAPGHFKKKDDLYNTIAAVPIKKGEQITQPRITYPGDRSGLSRQISIGKRAMTIRVNKSTSVGQLIKPGDRVDIITALDYSSGKIEKIEVITPLQDVFVLATGLKVTNSLPMTGMQVDKEVRKLNLTTYSNYNTVTLEVSPFEAQKLLFLQNNGSGLSLVLRNNEDKSIEKISKTKLFDVLGEGAIDAKRYFERKAELERKRLGN